VKLRVERAVPFISFFTGGPMDVEAEATAALVFNAEMCVISLENTGATGVTFSGSTQVDLGCGVATNSTSAQAITAGGGSRVVASPIAAVGGVPPSSSYIGETLLLPSSSKQVDPFLDRPEPQLPPTCSPPITVQPNQTRSLTAGCYRGMDLKGDVTLGPGTYFIDGSSLSFGSQANVTGQGVTFVLTGRNAVSNPASIATLDMHGGAVVNLTAPSSGPYTGLIMYQDRRATMTNIHINGNSASRFQGAFYFPSQQVTFNGNTGMRTRCIQFVARRMVFTGNSSIQNECPEDEGAKAFDHLQVRLVG
jgi:hypothetical protein